LAQRDFEVKFWGVRGSIPCPGPETVRYGGNTSCVEVRCGDHLLIFDGGSGLRPLGNHLIKKGHPVELDIFYSHTHLDHILGLPFFAPCYDPRNRVRIWAGHLKPHSGIEAVLGKMMSAPLFPIPIDIFAAQMVFVDFTAGETLSPHPGVEMKTGPLDHPNGATGYRVESSGKSLAYITDTEHREGKLDPNVLRLVDQVDVMVYDTSYTDEEYPAHRDWGHSTWEEGVRLADAAKVRQLVLFHHDPAHDDEFMDKVKVAAEKMRPGTIVAHEGMVLRP
jgi:phosphoribosyl 1,2-cyclic phosphodiesterase